ncbi:MAG: putative multidrug ABC transporter ATP-binding protein YbhF [Anaerolineales bacterium]|nr:putative multidrug ABC transporter ATP-binding protein YbhF [Anaerolineales bacterium]
MEPAIVVQDLTKTFEQNRGQGGFTAVDHISFEVQQGEIFGFLGPNGAGKTTTIRMLLGLMRPTAGDAIVLGHHLPDEAKAVHARSGYMSQLFTLYDDLTAAENIRFYGQAYGLGGSDLRRRQEDLIAMAGLSGRENELTAHLAGGWRQRLALGCAIVHDPELVFLDEPTAGVDPASRRAFWELIYALARQGTTVFVTTHYMDEAELCQRLAFIDRGRIVALGTPDELRVRHMRGDVLELSCAQPEAAMQVLQRARQAGRLEELHQLSFYGAQLHVVARDSSAVQGAIRRLLSHAGIQGVALDQIPPTLEDVFISTMGQAGVRSEGAR